MVKLKTIVAGMGVLIKIIAPIFVYFYGRKVKEAEENAKDIKAVKEAKKIRHKLRTNKRYADRIRRMFRR